VKAKVDPRGRLG